MGDDDREKQSFMSTIKMILKADPKTIKLLRKYKMLNMKTIERASKCTKDPNPLASTMSIMNTKYPILIDKTKAEKFKIPSEFMAKGKIGEDTHKHNKILCKKEAIEWWIEKSPIPDEENLKVIDILYKQSRQNVLDYYNVNWSNARVKWGQTIMERKLVPTRKPLVDIPKQIRESAVKEIMFRDYTVPNVKITEVTKEKIQLLQSISLEGKLTLSRQIRLLLNEMDPREHYLPVIPGMSTECVIFKHAFHHNNYVMTGYKFQKAYEKSDMEANLNIFIRALIFECRNSKFTQEEAMEICSATKVNSEEIVTILEHINLEETNEVKWLKALYKRESTLQFTTRSLTLCPESIDITPAFASNQSGIRMKELREIVRVHFKYQEMKGSFSYTRGYIIELVTNFTTKKDLSNLLVEIAVYIRAGFTSTRGKSIQDIEEELRQMHYDRPYQLIGLKKHEFYKINSESKSDQLFGRLRIDNNTEYITTGIHQLELDKEFNIISTKTHQFIPIPISSRELKSFNQEIDCQDTRMINHFDFKHTIKNRVENYFLNYPTLLGHIKNRNYTWKNNVLVKFIGKDHRSISRLCRHLLEQIIANNIENQPVTIILYCFTYSEPLMCMPSKITFVIREGFTVDIDGRKGIFTYDTQKGCYKLFGMKMKNPTRKLSRDELFKGILRGFKLTESDGSKSQLKSIRYLEENYETIHEGDRFKIYFCGAEFEAEKDSTLTYNTSMTINRHLREGITRMGEEARSLHWGKRGWLEGINDEEEDIPEKRQKTTIDDALQDLGFDITCVEGMALEMDFEDLDFE